ncbi:hypothetical protein GCM10023068_11120 [Leifsonia shinshuensis]
MAASPRHSAEANAPITIQTRVVISIPPERSSASHSLARRRRSARQAWLDRRAAALDDGTEEAADDTER